MITVFKYHLEVTDEQSVNMPASSMYVSTVQDEPFIWHVYEAEPKG